MRLSGFTYENADRFHSVKSVTSNALTAPVIRVAALAMCTAVWGSLILAIL